MNSRNQCPLTPIKGQVHNGSVIFSDIHGFSKVKEVDRNIVYKNFYSKLLPYLYSQVIQPFRGSDGAMVAFNTWGDGMMAAFSDMERTVSFLLAYRNFFRDFPFAECDLPKMKPRIAAHFGRFELFQDPMLNGQWNITGENVIIASRVEPVTRNGDIFATKAFRDAACACREVDRDYEFISLGELPLAKGFGSKELYRLRHRNNDPPQIIDPIMRQNLDDALPRPQGASQEEQTLLNDLKETGNLIAFRALVRNHSLLQNMVRRSGPFLFEMAQLYKGAGLYDDAIAALDQLQDVEILADELEIHPYQYDPKVLKLKTDCLSRCRRYKEAANLIYGVWKGDESDSDTLSMLAAQYKRRGLYGDNTIIDPTRINHPMVLQARNLYKEAFRRNVNDYYPAINAAYLGVMMGNDDEGEGKRLAEYIMNSWQEGMDIDQWLVDAQSRGERPDWWLPASVAEAQMLLYNDFINFTIPRFIELVEKLRPTWFERASTREQIEIYGIVTQRQELVRPLLELLDPRT